MPEVKQLERIVNKKALKKIDWSVVKRLVIFLYYNSKIKKTNIAMKCNIGYDKCVLYLNWLELMDLIERKIDVDGFEIIILSERGNDFYKRKLENAQDGF